MELPQTLRDLGYGDATARNMYSELDYFLPVPAGQVTAAPSQIDLVISHSPLLVADRSTLTVVVDGQSVGSTFLTPENRSRAHFVAQLPAEAPGAKGLFVQLRFYQRLTHDICEETVNPGLWSTVSAESRLSLNTADPPGGRSLAGLSQLYAPAARGGSPTVMVVSQRAQPGEVEAAGAVAFQLGRWAAQAQTDPILGVAHEPVSGSPAVVVGAGSQLTTGGWPGGLRWDGHAFLTHDGQVDSSHGLLAVSQQGPPELLVSGADAGATLTAARSLTDPAQLSLLGGPVAALSGNRVAGLPRASLPWDSSAASFAQLGAEQQQVLGPGPHDLALSFDRPPGWSIRDGAVLDLVVVTSAALRAETSTVAVSLNGQEVGNQRLQASSSPRHYRFELSSGLLNSRLDGQPVRRLSLALHFFLDLNQTSCMPQPVDGAQVTVLPTSAWYLPHDKADALDLGRFPAPLVDQDSSRLDIVLPTHLSDQDLAAGLQLAAAIGRWAEPGIEVPRLVTVDRLTGAEPRSASLLLVGEADREMGHRLSGPVSAQAATLVEEASPWASGRYLVAVHARDSRALALGAQALARGSVLERVRGRQVVVFGDRPPHEVVAGSPPGAPPPELSPRLEVSWLDTISVQRVAGAALLVVAIAVAVVIVRRRWWRALRRLRR